MNQQPVYPGSRQPPPLSNGTRNGSASGPTGVKQPEPLESTQSRAARFEDEKRRIIESCFNKRDPDGMQVESYITHVKVLEDGSYPSSPPPPDAPSANKKSRVILVAVRRSGKVRVHKARENPTGTFSIGKTWNLDELNAIMSYSALVPATPQQQLEKQWGSNTGFTVTLGKPYFWAAPTPKEKDFFIASLIKIYRKYTGGKVPELIGFAPQEIAQLTSAPPSAQNTPTPRSGAFSPPVPSDHSTPPAPPPSVPTLSSNRPQSPYTAHQPPPSRDGNRVVSQEQDRSFTRQEYRPATRDGPRPPSQLENRPPPPRQERTTPVPEPSRGAPFGAQFRRDDGRTPSLTDSLQSPPSLPTMNSKPSQSSLQRAEPPLDPQPLRPNGLGVIKPSGLDVNGKRLGPQPSQDSFRSAGRNDVLGGSRPSTATTDRRTPEPPPTVPARSVPAPIVAELEAPPLQERKGSVGSGAEQAGRPSADSSRFVTPMGTPDDLKEEEDQNREANYFANKKAEAEVKQAANNVVPLSNAALEPVAQEDPPSTITNEPVTAEPADTVPPPPIPEEFRPGLGPMVKKKSGRDIANQFRKAALAASAFQPRQGGAGARLKAMQEKQSNEPDGITSVVPAPLFRGMSTDSAGTGVSEVPSPITETDKPVSTSPAPIDAIPKVQIERRATTDNVARSESPVPQTAPVAAEVPREPEVTASPERARSRSPQRRRRQKLEAEVEKYCLSLGIDPRVTDGRGADFNELLTEFGWEGRLDDQHKVDDFENDVRREIGRAQASGWLGHVEQQENKVQELSKAFDRAIAECEELDGLLTLYAHELDTLHDDIEYIEAQGQGLQVQTANQKLLQAELESLLKTLTISSGELRPLKAAPIDSFDGLRAIEDSLALLYRAMLTIDPDIRQNKLRQAAAASTDRPGVGVYADTQFGEMLAVKQKKEEYKEQSMMFVNRLNQHMKAMFQMAEQRTSEENAAASISSGTSTTLSLRAYNASRQELWVYNALMLFVREFNQYEWQTLISSYEINVKGIYQDQFRDFAMGLRKTARKPTGEELEILFTHQEKEKAEESLTSTAARKLTVRRVRAQKSSILRQSIGEKRDGRPEAWSVFDTVLEQQASAISEEQNFIVHFFHANSQSNADFAELVVSRQPEQRKLPNLQAKQSYDPDRNMAKIVQNTAEGIYSFWPMELQAMLDWVVKTDQMQSVGILVSLEQCLAKYEETNQEFITRTVRGLHDRLTGLFHKFIEDQVKAIEETKVKVKKRKGLISFMRVFPDFITAVEDMIPQEFAHQESLEVRFIVNDGYIRLLKAMWESLNFIAKDNPASATGGAQSTAPTSGDPEDKEALNYHILLIENMNYFVEEVKTHHNIVLEEWTERAQRDQVSHLSQYVDAVIRRPLGKWLDFLESTEALMKATDSYTSIANKPSHSRSSAKKVLSAHDTKEIRKGVETLKKRIEKHFTDADDPGSSNRALIGRVFEECAVRYANAYDRMRLVIDRVYEGGLEIDWRKEDAAAIFKR
ncbi:GTP-Rho binding exocyst subunit [Elasticomyces elasticus]|uniref:GTP-Rho binding exocyst subunit n=1 Tax=Exophiala sideris TaxID=1016849 RepID=A0ABR0JQK3_9EURO|nr:GTP-Rho binding exocyst subunit [Elasticomyces elasticus]KAK5039865.1 GTP-Rho binding exocyst subunit [Exophiala sideris]KAK5041417.1 GTP-Rho binding exocyst subunit [Exophiala sideris]KAK5068244.1 GTP-Rho binding exocyst subunit [Exophiala sideris]KAK5187545.1 GTP-Rho binding exocyst subunit [Eurotiomycetes sp. CCFEE 6388]